VLKALHDVECIPTECIPHLWGPHGRSSVGTTAVSSSVTSRFLPTTLRIAEGACSGAGSVSERESALPDEILLAEISVGEREALALLFRRYAHLVRNVGQRILRDRSEADDLVQEVFLYIHRKSSLFDSSKGSARSWIVQVAYTQAFLRRRLLKSKGFYLSAIADRYPESDSRAYSGAEYDQSVEGLFGRNSWHKALESLSEEQRETLRLHFFEGYTFAEIAEKLNQTHANVRHHHYRGLEKIRKQLGEEELNKRSST
jgi:RNA polymerase sigma-70 factor (ECF subfamily)